MTVSLPKLALGPAQGNGEVPGRPDLSGNGEGHEAVTVAEGDGSAAAQTEAVAQEPPTRGRRKKKA